MADWIKMRSSLLTNPKVIRMARVLLADPQFMDWLCPGRGCDAVTERDVPVVTRIVVGSLLATWSAANDTAARDGIVRHAASRDIDQTAGVPGFGKALAAVGWLEDLPDGEGICFTNFEEHNSPQKERSLTAKSGAERNKEYRERKKQETLRDAQRDGARDVTVTSQRDDRVGKKRVEKKNPSGSTPPVKPASKPKAAKRVPADFEVTAELQTWAAEKAPQVDWHRETEKFRDWEFQHARTDWSATWRTWMRKAEETAVKNGGAAPRQEGFV